MNRFYAGSEIVFGQGALDALPGLLSEYRARRVMIICDPGVRAAGIAELVIEQVRRQIAHVFVFDGVAPNPTNALVEQTVTQAKEFAADLFVAVGGGSVLDDQFPPMGFRDDQNQLVGFDIDLAKAVSLRMTNPGPIGRYGGMGLVEKAGLPLIAVPTTAGTSSEITNVCALIDQETVTKYVIIDNKITPDRVILDPLLTKSLPPSVTAATGMDAITHAIESFVSNMATPLTEYHSLRGLQVLYKNLPLAYEDGGDLAAREQMMLGCAIVGFGFLNANLGLVHGIAHTLSAHFGLAHGAANAAVLPYVLAFNAPTCGEKMIDMAKALGLPLSGDKGRDSLALSEEMERLVRRLNIPSLSQSGVLEKDFDMLAECVLREPVLQFNPRQAIKKGDVLAILRRAL